MGRAAANPPRAINSRASSRRAPGVGEREEQVRLVRLTLQPRAQGLDGILPPVALAGGSGQAEVQLGPVGVSLQGPPPVIPGLGQPAMTLGELGTGAEDVDVVGGEV